MILESRTFSTYLLAAVLLSMYAGACGQSPAVKDDIRERFEKYGNGAVSRKYREINGKKEGKMVDYYPDGRLKAERWFEHDKQSGRTVLFYPEGQLMEVQYYQNGKKEGGDTLFYQTGQPQFALWYTAEQKNGYLRKWTAEGKIVFEARYEKDSLVEVKGVALKPGATPVSPEMKAE